MATPVPLGDVNSLVHDENALPPSSPKHNSSSSSNPSSPKPLSPSNKQQQLTVDTASDTKAGFVTTADSLAFSAGSSSSDDNFSIDRYASNLNASMEEANNHNPSETPRLQQMMEKFDLLQSSSIDEPQQDQMMAKFDKLQKSEIAAPQIDPVNDAEVYRDKRLFEIMSPTNSQEGVEVEVHEATDDEAFASYSQSNSYSSNEMFADIEQFRSAESHIEPETTDAISPDNKVAAKNSSSSNMDSTKIYEQRIVALMNKVSELELEKDELRAQKDDLRSKLNVQHEQDVQDMYQNPYSDPFAAATPTKQTVPSFLETATSNLSQQQQQPVSLAPSLSTASAAMDHNAELHRELTELRMKNQSLQTDLDASDRVKERLKKILKTVQAEDQQKVDLLNKMTKELDETKTREAGLKVELDKCKVRIEGYELAQKMKTSSSFDEGETSGEQASKQPSSPLRSVRSATNTARKSFFSSSSETPAETSDVATALVVSQRQNEALEAFNKELEAQNTNLQKKCDALTEKYGLSAPKDGDAKGNQLYSRYLEMKSSLSSLSVVLEEAQGENTELSQKVKELESELQKQGKPSKSAEGKDAAPIDSLKSIFHSTESLPSSSSNTITAEQEEALKGLVEKLEVQILGYREAEERHGEIVAQLEKEASELRQELEDSQSHPSSAVTPDLERCYEELESKIASNENSSGLKEELKSLKRAMDAAAAESAKLMKELERVLASTREELRNERNRFVELSAKHDALLKKIATDDNEGVFEENEKLLTQVSSLKKETKELRTELEQKSIKIEKSEKRVTAKHEQALQLNEANASLRDGIHKLKAHLSTINEQASKTEEKLASARQELNSEREKAQKLEIAHGTLQTKITVLQESIDGNHDDDSSQKIELTASLAASKKELSLQKERVQTLLEDKKELESALDSTKEDLETQLHIKNKSNSELEEQVTKLQEELEASKLVVAAANLKMEELNKATTNDSEKLKGLLNSTKELLATEKTKSKGLETLKSALESRLERSKQSVEELQSTNKSLEEELEVLKKKSEKPVYEESRQFGELEKLLATTQQELNEEEEQVESLEKQVDDLTMQMQELEKCKRDLEISLEDVKQEMKTATDKNEELETLLETMAKDTVGQVDEGISTASTDVRLWESEMLLGNTKRDLEQALKQNEALHGKVNNLESEVEKSQQTNAQTLKECETHEAINKEMAENIQSLEAQLVSLTEQNESLLKRTATLARRDQLQKASLHTSNEEMTKLMETVTSFQSRFETLAGQVEQGQAEKETQTKEYEEEEAKWISRNVELEDYVATLKTDCEDIQRRYDELDARYIQTLAKKDSDYQTEKMALTSRIAQLENQDGSTEENPSDKSPDAYYAIQPCATDRSMLNQKMLELEQDIQLLDVTLGDKKQEHLVASAELEVTKQKLELCEEKLETYEEELKSSKAEIHTLVLKSATDQASFQGKIRELEEELNAANRERDSVQEEHGVTQTILEVSKEDLKRSQDDLLDREKKIEEIEAKMVVELKTAMEEQQDLQSKYNTCLKELSACKIDLVEKEEIMRELAKKQVEQKDGDVKRETEKRNKEALAHLTDELNEAHIRENALENLLSSCQTELASCKKKLEAFETQVSEEKFGSGVYKDVIAKLNRSNDNLVAKNKKLKDETEVLKASAESLKKKVNKLKHENEIARVVVGGDNNVSNPNISQSSINSQEVERENIMMKDLLATSQISVAEAKNMQKVLSSQVEAATKRETKLTKEILALKARNADMAQRLEEQENELDEFESDFALARNDARKVVEELRSQLTQLEKRNKQLEAASGGLNAIEDLKMKLKQLVHKNKRLEKEIATCKARERRLESELGLEPRRSR